MILMHRYTIVRRCGTSNSVSEYEGQKTYFCSSNLCNGIGADNNKNYFF